MAYQRIPGLDRAGAAIAAGITNWKNERRADQDREALARVFSSLIGQGGAGGSTAGAGGAPAPGGLAPQGAGLLAGVDPKDLARAVSSGNFDPSMLTQLLKGGGSGGKTYQTLAGGEAAKYLGLEDFGGGAIQVGSDGKVDVIVTPPDLKSSQRPTSLSDGWYYDPADKQLKRLPGYQEEKMSLASAGASRTNVNVSPTAIYKDTQGAAANPLYKASSDAAVQTMQEADTALQDLQNIQSLNRALEGLNTGSFTEAKTGVLKGLQQLGIDIAPDEVQSVEAAQNISADLILRRMKALGGNDTTEERQWVQNTTPSVLMTPAGRQMVEYIQQRRADRLDKQATFEADLAQKVADGTVSPGEARRLARSNNQALLEQDKKTWDPPKVGNGSPTVSTGNAVPGSGNTPDMKDGLRIIGDEAGYNSLKSGDEFWWRDANGNLRRGRKP